MLPALDLFDGWDSIRFVGMLQNLDFFKYYRIESISSICTSDPTTGKNPFCSDHRSLYWEIVPRNKCPCRILNAVDLSKNSVRGLREGQGMYPPPANNIPSHLWCRSQVCLKLCVRSWCFGHISICLTDHILHPSGAVAFLPSWGTWLKELEKQTVLEYWFSQTFWFRLLSRCQYLSWLSLASIILIELAKN